MTEIHGVVSVPTVRPSDIAACASVLSPTDAGPHAFDRLVARLASERSWAAGYAEAIALRCIALGRYLRSPTRARDMPEVLMVLAAAATPITTDEGFDHELLESVARLCARRLESANERAA